MPLPMPCVEKSTPFMQFKVVAVSKNATKNIILKIMWECFRAQYIQKPIVVQVVLSIVNHLFEVETDFTTKCDQTTNINTIDKFKTALVLPLKYWYYSKSIHISCCYLRNNLNCEIWSRKIVLQMITPFKKCQLVVKYLFITCGWPTNFCQPVKINS